MDETLKYAAIIIELQRMDARLVEIHDELVGANMYIRPNGSALFDDDGPMLGVLDELHRKLGEAVMAAAAEEPLKCACGAYGNIVHYSDAPGCIARPAHTVR